jgi:hypothetical protein
MECVQNTDGRTVEKHPLGTLIRQWEDNIEANVRENGCGAGRDCTVWTLILMVL